MQRTSDYDSERLRADSNQYDAAPYQLFAPTCMRSTATVASRDSTAGPVVGSTKHNSLNSSWLASITCT